jgi:hypothetical protein
LKRVDDDEEPVDGNRRQRQRGRVYACTLGVWHDMTEYLTKHPMTCINKNKNIIIASFQNVLTSLTHFAVSLPSTNLTREKQ